MIVEHRRRLGGGYLPEEGARKERPTQHRTTPGTAAHYPPGLLLSLGLLGLSLPGMVVLLAPSSVRTAVLAVFGLLLGALIVAKMPEATLPLFLFAGQFKASPFFAPLSDLFDLTVAAALLTILAMVQVIWIERRPIRVDKRLLAVWLSLCILMTASLLWTPSIGYGALKTSQLFTLGSLAFFAPAVFFSSGPLPVRRFLYSLLAFATVYSLAALPEGLSTRTEMAFVSIPGANYLGLGRIASAGIVIASTYILPRGGWSMALGLVSLAISGVALLLSGGRGPLLALGAALPVLAVLSVRALGRHGLRIMLLVLLLIVAFGAVLLSGLMPATISYRLALLDPDIIEQDSSSSAGMRVHYWQAAREALLRYPVLGLGSGGFAHWFVGSDAREYPHNILLEAGSELGVAGLALMLSLLVIPCAVWWSGSRRPLQREQGLLRISILGLLIVYWGNAMVSGDLNDNRMALMCSALTVAYCRLPSAEGSTPQRNGNLLSQCQQHGYSMIKRSL